MHRVFATAAVLAAGIMAAAQATSTLTTPLTLQAFAVNMNNTRPGHSATVVDLHVDRWSPDADRDRLLSLFEQQGQDALLDALQKLPVVGYIRTPESLRYDVHFARQIPQAEGGSKIVLLTDRHIGMWEAVNRPRSIDYPFTLVELQLDRTGHGVGKASVATRITKGDDGTIELEDFQSVPVVLNDVKIAPSK